MPKPIQNPRVGQALAREFNLVGRVHPSLDEVVVPVVLAGDVRSTVAPLTREATIRAFQPAVAAEFAYMRLETPAGTLARIHAVIARPSADDTLIVHYGSQSAAPADLQTALTFTDGRMRAGGESPGVRLGHDTLAALPATTTRHANVAAFTTDVGFTALAPFTMGRGDAEDFVEFYLQAANLSLDFTVFFEEFPYQTSTVR